MQPFAGHQRHRWPHDKKPTVSLWRGKVTQTFKNSEQPDQQCHYRVTPLGHNRYCRFNLKKWGACSSLITVDWAPITTVGAVSVA